jgi:hypothetical protein
MERAPSVRERRRVAEPLEREEIEMSVEVRDVEGRDR